MARILVIDDDSIIRETIKAILKDSNHDIVEAISGEEGLEFFRKEPADLVIVDLVLPGIGGLDVIKELKADYPDIRMIAMSGYVPSQLPMADVLGVNQVFSKPFDTSKFLWAVQELVRAQ